MKALGTILCAGTLLLGVVQGDSIQDVFVTNAPTMGMNSTSKTYMGGTRSFKPSYSIELDELASELNTTLRTIEDKFIYDGSGGSIVHGSNHTLNYMVMMCGVECEDRNVTVQDVRNDISSIVFKLSRCIKDKLMTCSVHSDHLYAEYYAGINTVYDVDLAADKARASVDPRIKAQLNVTEVDTLYDDADWNVGRLKKSARGRKASTGTRTRDSTRRKVKRKSGKSSKVKKLKSGAMANVTYDRNFVFRGIPLDPYGDNGKAHVRTLYNESKPGDWIYENVDPSTLGPHVDVQGLWNKYTDTSHMMYNPNEETDNPESS
ncbi:hypothetical protein HDU86_007567 [Geranomyces michiganensis]|nr:hypothetical protein HDU86_007567 [Geranomyces michiganensis]